MPFDTSMYQNFQGGTGLAALAQGLRTGLDIANQRKEREQRDKQIAMQEQSAQRQQAAFDSEQQAREMDLQSKIGGWVGERSGQLLSMKDPQTAQAAWANTRNDLIRMGAKPQQLPEDWQAAQPMANFYNQKYQKAQQAVDLDAQKTRAEIRKLQAEAAKAGRPTSMSLGKAPEGYRFRLDGSLEPIPGGPAAGKVERQQDMQKQQASLVVQDIGRAMNLLNNSSTAAGPWAGKLGYIPGTDAWQLSNMLDSVKANIGFDKLQAMRNASPTGGALGSISDKETAMLQATAGKLDGNLPPEMLADNMKRLANQYNDIVHGKGNGPKRFELSFDENGNPIAKKDQAQRPNFVQNAIVPDAKAAGSQRVFKTNEIEW